MTGPTSETFPLPPGDPLYGSPTAVELLAVVEHFLRHELGDLPALTAFHARVAANVVAMVGRQLTAGDGPRQEMADLYARLGAVGERALADAVRSGQVEATAAVLRPVLEPVVRARLEVANPRYLVANPLPD